VITKLKKTFRSADTEFQDLHCTLKIYNKVLQSINQSINQSILVVCSKTTNGATLILNTLHYTVQADTKHTFHVIEIDFT